ncbi:membrane hypothetical protein [Bradyrhizobium sp. ORS 375]|uniref:hypothetical protein n=1 Tax=Bradyrhizobium sp. (strain ORS 375) TaxID=566679 RepID=UPI0002405D87|nr:hypothetical protein [Bradyrhizobium sp. ORS 375]CCD92415.1 membrane hypothetical protein [Bradyrhizobium sp. ORS 375]
MYVVRNSLQALFAALIPLALVEAILVAMAALALQAASPPELPVPDQVVMLYAQRIATDAALLFAGHWLLQQARMASRIAYGLMGGVMSAASYAIAVLSSATLPPGAAGVLLTIGLLPAVAGMICGFLYHQFAGLVPAPSRGSRGRDGAAAEEGPRTFDGPIRVRTSVAGISIAATMPAVLTAILSFTITTLLLPRTLADGTGPLLAAAIPAQMFMAILVATSVPSAIFVLALHHIARALGRQRGYEYAGIGAAMAVAFVLLIMPFMPVFPVMFLLLPALTYGGIMGALYRRFAGLEPVPLPEAVIASDVQALVAADHPSRQRHGVIISP